MYSQKKCCSHGILLRTSITLIVVCLLLIETFGGAPTAVGHSEAVPYMVKDIFPGEGDSQTSVLIDLNGILLFQATDGEHGRELWKSDGTEEGTVMVKDINPGPSSAIQFYPFVPYKKQIFFAANGSHGVELWKSDGTPEGTTMVKDIFPEGDSNPAEFAIVGDTLFFIARDSQGYGLWKTDGSEAGTVLVKAILSIPYLSYPPYGLTGINGTLYFSADDGTHGYELWKSDGTAAGTYMIKDICSTGNAAAPHDITFVNGLILFTARDCSVGWSLWKTDGSEEGTVIVKDLQTGEGDPDYVGSFFALGDKLLFGVWLTIPGSEDTTNDQLWISDGTEAGTTLVKDIYPGGNSVMRGFTLLGNNLYFAADDGVHGAELWKTDGTPEGTQMVIEINPSTSGDETGSSPSAFTRMNDTLYFRAYEPVHGSELWKTDGTGTGTSLAAEINPHGNSEPNFLKVSGDKLFFGAYDSSHGQELWALPIRVFNHTIFLPSLIS